MSKGQVDSIKAMWRNIHRDHTAEKGNSAAHNEAHAGENKVIVTITVSTQTEPDESYKSLQERVQNLEKKYNIIIDQASHHNTERHLPNTASLDQTKNEMRYIAIALLFIFAATMLKQ